MQTLKSSPTFCSYCFPITSVDVFIHTIVLVLLSIEGIPSSKISIEKA